MQKKPPPQLVGYVVGAKILYGSSESLPIGHTLRWNLRTCPEIGDKLQVHYQQAHIVTIEVTVTPEPLSPKGLGVHEFNDDPQLIATAKLFIKALDEKTRKALKKD